MPRCVPYFKKYKQALSRQDLKPMKPMLSWLPTKKMVVLAEKDGKQKVVHFGHIDYEDYTTHCDDDRRKRYLQRSGGILDGSNKLTKDDVFSANYWARKILW